jgi:hypothetical protein
MAPKKMPSRRMPASRKQGRAIDKVLREGTFTTADPQGQINVLRQYQNAGLIPSQFNTPKEVSDAVIQEVVNGKSKREALAKLGIKLGPSFFDKKGALIGRKFRDAQSPALVEAWNQRTQGLTAQQLSKLERSEWSDLQKYYQDVGRRLGMKLDIGHFATSASGAPGNVAAGGAEYARANQAAGRSAENPFRPQTAVEMAEIGMATNKVQGLGEAALLGQDLPTRGGLKGAPLNPYISVLLGTTLDGQSSRLLPTSNLEALNFTFDQLEKQGANPVAMYDYIRERAGEGINIEEMARVGQEQYDISKFAPDVPNPQVGTARVVQPATPKSPTATTKGVPKGLMPKGVTRNPLMRGARAISRAIPGPADALLPGVVGGGLALASGATLPQAAEAFGAGVAEGLTGDLDAGPLGSDQAVIIDGQQRFINRRNELMDKPGYGLEQSGGQWREVKRGTGAASQQERQALRSTAQQAANLIPKVNRAINPVGAGIMDFFAKPIGSAFNRIFGKREI